MSVPAIPDRKPDSSGMTPRFHVPGPLSPNSVVELAESAAHHAVRVLRLRTGDEAVLFDGRGGEYSGRISDIGKKILRVAVGEHHAVERESPLDVTVVQGISSGDRMDVTVQKAVELGIRRIVPLASERSVVRLTTERAGRRVEHWQQIAIHACEQCGRNRVPVIDPVIELGDIPEPDTYQIIRWMLSPSFGSERLRDLAQPELPIMLLIGPEGGFSDSEVTLALKKGFRAVNLGPRVLRTETAGATAMAAIQALWGDF